MGVELEGRTTDSVRRCLQQAIRSAGRANELYVVTDSDVRRPTTQVAIMRREPVSMDWLLE